MTKKELMDEIEALVVRAGEENVDTLAAVGSLYSLLGAMASGHDNAFLEHASAFSRAYLAANQ